MAKSPPVHQATTLLIILVLNLHCTGLFTSVPLPPVRAAEARALDHSIHAMSAFELRERLDTNYYHLLFEEYGGLPGEQVSEFVERMRRTEVISPSALARVTGYELGLVRKANQAREAEALSQEVARVQAPIARRLKRVSRRIAEATGRSDISFTLDSTMGFNAGVPAGFGVSTIYVGPPLALLCQDEDELAMVLGHEAAHVIRGHPRGLAVQVLLVATLKLAALVAVAVLEAHNQREGRPSIIAPADAATIVGAVATGTIKASGYGRDKEREADYYGLQYALRAGYRPDAALGAFRSLLAFEKGEGRTLELPWLASHPTTAERLVRMQRWLDAGASPSDATEPMIASRTPISGSPVAAVGRPQPDEDRGQDRRADDGQGARTEAPTDSSLPSEQSAEASHDSPRWDRGRKAGPGPSIASSEPSGPTCWWTRGASGEDCTSCCPEDGLCHTDCTEGSAQASSAGRPKTSICWNVNASGSGGAGVCTTCCTADVTCETTCSSGD